MSMPMLSASRVRRAVLVLLVAGLCLSKVSAIAGGPFRDMLRKRFESRQGSSADTQTYQIAGLEVAVWKPVNNAGPAPLVIFSHGFHGRNTQSIFIMKALADDGYLVVAPNHKDAMGMGQGMGRPEVGFGKVAQWTDATYRDRCNDITRLVQALRADPRWSSRIDWSRVALSGHSLGGYTALGLAGAWPSWKLGGVKAVLALSPYCNPLVQNGNLGGLGMPVMYQTGTSDFGVAPFVVRHDGAYDKTSSPAYLVDFAKFNHFAWSNFNADPSRQELINHYCIAFLDKYVKGDPAARPELKLSGVVDLRAK